MAIPPKRKLGDLIKSEDWNAILDELNRLEGDKLAVTGGSVGGPLKIGKSPNSELPALDIDGGHWDLTSTEGDLRIGSADYRLKIGVATRGAGKGDARIQTHGGVERLMLGDPESGGLILTEGRVGIGTIEPKTLLHLRGGSDPTLRIQSDGNNEISGRLSLRQKNKTGADIYYDGRDGTENEHFAVETFNRGQTKGVKLCLKLDGKVGVGTIEPKTLLHLRGGSDPTLRIQSDGANEISGRLSLRQENKTGADIYYDGRDGAKNEHLAVETFNGGETKGVKLCLKLDGKVGVGTVEPEAKLHVAGDLQVDQGLHAKGGLQVDGDLSAKKIGGRLTTRAITFENSSAPTGTFLPQLSRRRAPNEKDFSAPNLKMTMGKTYDLKKSPSFEFAIGYEAYFKPPRGRALYKFFKKVFSVTKNGVTTSGEIGCYIVDHFINRIGETVERGDVVIIEQAVTQFSGADDNIPIPEVGLANRAGDTRVCGIVARAVTRAGLPYAELQIVEPAGSTKESDSDTPESESLEHPLAKYSASPEEAKANKVGPDQMGTMVTSGSFAHCKVDADIASIEVGDLLMTSPTPGHAQKVGDKSRAVGAVIGKALASLARGRGKIPVMVMLQ